MKKSDGNRRLSGFRSSLKSMDTEETFDLMFYRPIGYAWALLARRMHIHPNVITIASIFLGVGAGICFYFDSLWYNLLGAFLLVWANTFDSADGQLARLTGQYSRLGRILDGVSGDLWFVAIYIAICLRENVTGHIFVEHHWIIWVMAAASGFCHAVQAAMADYYRQFHLYFLNIEGRGELDSAAALWERFHALSWRHDFWQKLVLLFYTNYTVGQEKRTPRMQALRRALDRRFGTDVPDSFRVRIRALSKPLMKYTNILSFNTRCFALFAAILVFRMPWLYFAFELTVLNVLLVYMMLRHEHICAVLADEVEEGDFG